MANAAGKLGIRLDGAAGGRAGLGSGLGSGSGAGSGSGTGAGYSDSAGLELSPAAAVILNPYKITICDGEETHYLLPRGSELFSAVVGNGRHFYEEILSRKPARDLAAADWADLVTRRSILIEFKIPIRQDVLKWAIDLYNTALNTPQDMRKLLIVPDDSAGKPAISLYVLSSDKITQFSLDSSDFAGVRTLLNENLRALGGEGAQNIVQYKTIGEFGGSSFPGFRSDVLCVVDGQKTNIYRKLKYSAPTDIRDKGDLEDIVLGNDIYSYNRSLDYSNTLVFKNITSIYRLRKDGFMEYSYTSPIQPFEKGGLVGALRSATEFVLNIETQLLGGADLYLSGIYENESDLTYRITFDYILDDYPVFFQYLQKQGDSTLTYQNAINVLANESRTISCKWTLVDLFFGTDVKRMQTYFQTIDSPESLTKMSVMDISISYYVDMNNYTNSTSLWPVWALELENGEVQMIPLRDG
ncbi:MAG: hypothetical protein LBJ10_04615 [Clostridiales bacterium]|jgi:hypothetical protein|nr:hypothetical protein [Clostridiales bacterium]